MVTIPLPIIVQRNDEQVGVLQLAQKLPGVLRLRNRLAQGCRHTLQYRTPEQELPLLLRQGGKDLLSQDFDDVAIAPSKRFYKGVRILLVPQREGGKVNRRGPSLGTIE